MVAANEVHKISDEIDVDGTGFEKIGVGTFGWIPGGVKAVSGSASEGVWPERRQL